MSPQKLKIKLRPDDPRIVTADRYLKGLGHHVGTALLASAISRAMQAELLAQAEAARLSAILNTPLLAPFADAVIAEAKHQRARHGDEHDASKSAWDWFWTLGYLGGKAAHADLARDHDKALHHTVTAAALLANWHRHIAAAREAAR